MEVSCFKNCCRVSPTLPWASNTAWVTGWEPYFHRFFCSACVFARPGVIALMAPACADWVVAEVTMISMWKVSLAVGEVMSDLLSGVGSSSSSIGLAVVLGADEGRLSAL